MKNYRSRIRLRGNPPALARVYLVPRGQISRTDKNRMSLRIRDDVGTLDWDSRANDSRAESDIPFARISFPAVVPVVVEAIIATPPLSLGFIVLVCGIDDFSCHFEVHLETSHDLVSSFSLFSLLYKIRSMIDDSPRGTRILRSIFRVLRVPRVSVERMQIRDCPSSPPPAANDIPHSPASL